MASSKPVKIILALVIIGSFAYMIYTFFIKNPEVGSDIVSVPTYQAAGTDILEMVDKLKNVSIESSVFSSTLFTNLKDFSVSLLPETQGRSNPFDVVGR